MAQSPSLTLTLFAWRKFIVRTTIVGAIVAVIVSLLLPSWFRASATIMPASESSSGTGILQLVSQLGSDLSAGAGKATRRLFGRNQGTELMLGVLQSRRIRGLVVDRFDLVDVYDVRTREHAIRELDKHLVVDTTPEGLIRVEVEDRDKQRAADMANAFLKFLDEFNREITVQGAERTIRFIESVIEENRARRDQAANRLREFQEEKGAIEISEQTRATVEALATLQAERMRLEVERGILENYTGGESAEMRRIADEIREIDKAIAELRGHGPDSSAAEADAVRGALLPLADIPRLGLEYADLRREVMVQSKVYEFLAAEYEDARIQQTRDQETITFLDKAVPPIRKARPRRSLIVILTFGMTLFATCGIALAAQALQDHCCSENADPQLRRALSPVLGILDRLRGTPAES